uniref:Regulator of chromosome condensation n=1 Tax=Panagrolaimus sp. PS1159 TaxID=55785 RepID=A0AC35F234_9BILA
MSAMEMEVGRQSTRVEGDEQEVSDTNELIVEEDLNATAEQVEQAEKEKDEPINPPSENEDEEMKEDGEKGLDKEVKKEGDKKEELLTARENDEAEEEQEEKPKNSRPSRNAKKALVKAEEAKKPPARARGKAKEKSPVKAATKEKPTLKKKTTSPAKKATPKKKEATPEPAPKGGKKRKIGAVENGTSSTTVKKHKLAKDIHVYADFVNEVLGDRVLSCGEGEQLGHPGRTTTKKPRAIGTLPENIKILQVVAGGVHTTILTDQHEVYSCGINEGGTVPVKDLAAEETKDELTIIEFTDDVKKEGKIVQLTSGAGFTAALTDLGSVIAWGNLRDEN